MQRFIRFTILAALLLVLPLVANAQFYTSGRGSATVRWEQMKASDYRLLYPDYYRPAAEYISGFMDSLRPYITYGLETDLAKTPLVIYTEDQYSNGMVTWAPKRAELATRAPINSTATPWVDQLVIHEWRHVAQISALRRGTTNVFRALMGQAGMGVGLIVNSSWMLEGDAVNAETQLTEYGRGLQPDFTIEYRALASEGFFDKIKVDLLACGSYKQNIPDEYKYGYQISTATETFVSPTIWGEIFAFNAKYPMLISPDYFLLKYKYKTSFSEIRRRAFSELDSLWSPLAMVDENFDYIDSTATCYTTYESPMAHNGGIVALKNDFKTPTHLVYIDSTGRESRLSYTGLVSSRATLHNDKVYLTEYQPNLFYELKNYSIVRSYDLSTGKWESYRAGESNYLVTPISHDRFATIKNDSLNNGYIQFYDKDFKTQEEQIRFEPNTTLHALAWDTQTSTLYFIAVDKRGMWIGGYDKEIKVIKEPSAVTLSELRAEDGFLVFGSIASGKDEVHLLEIETRREYQLTKSRFGSGQPSISDSTLYHRAYTADGWLLAKQKIETTAQDTIAWSRLPENILNPQRIKWEIEKISDSLTIAQQKSTLKESPKAKHQTKRYTRTPHLFNFHSWAPVAVDFDGLYNELSLKFGYGATGFFQSTLSDMEGSLTLGGRNNQFWGLTSFKYSSLPVEFEVKAEYGGANQTTYATSSDTKDEYLESNTLKPYVTASIEATLPMNLTRGSNLRLLQPSLLVTHYNSLFISSATTSSTGYQKWDASLWWSSTRRTAYQDIVPRMGYALKAGVSSAWGNDFSTLYYLWGRAYLPGVAKTHSITLRASAQYQDQASYQFSGKVQAARGVDDPYAANRYAALSLDYTMPLWCPDGGIDGIINFKRIYINLFGDYTKGDYFSTTQGQRVGIANHSYGIDLGFDINILRSTDQRLELTFAYPNSRDFHFGLGFSFGF